MAQNDNNQICKESAIEHFTEYLNKLLEDDCYVHNFALIGGEHYWIYSTDRMTRIKEALIKKYSELL